MKLPDYFSCVEVKEILINMGIITIPELEPIDFTYETSKIKEIEVENPTLQFSERLMVGAISLSDPNITVTISQDGTIEVNGLKACAYIKKQYIGVDIYSKSSGYRYHLCNCQTIQRMIHSQRLSRYVSTTRSDGFFPVITQVQQQARECIIKLELCQNCRDILRSRGMLPEPYSLKRFFAIYQPNIPPTILRTEQVIVEEKYAPNHPEIARRYKKKANYCCQICGVNCSRAENHLHLHHKDGNGQNNNRSNLLVLCIDCHSRQPMHTHMRNIIENIRLIAHIKQLRKEQGIHEL